jgi:hypothetical protein
MELDAPQPEVIETVEPVGTPKEPEPTDLAPSLSAAEELSQSVPEPAKPARPVETLEEVDEGTDNRFEDDDKEKEDEGEDAEVVEEEEEEERPKRKAKKREKTEYRTPYYAQKPRSEGLTRNRLMGGIGTGMGGVILIGTLAHHLTASQNAWHAGVCCADIFALALVGVGLFFLIRG